MGGTDENSPGLDVDGSEGELGRCAAATVTPRGDPEKRDPVSSPATATYEVRLEGRVDAEWSEWLTGFELRHEAQPDGPSETVILLRDADAATLHGLLAHIGALNIGLVSVMKIVG